MRYERPVLEPSKVDDPYGKMLLRRRSPYTSITLVGLAIASIGVPLVAANAETHLEWISVMVGGIPFPLFFAYAIAIRLEIFERVIRVRKLWGTRVIPVSQLQSFYRQPGASGAPARLIFRPRDGRSIHVTVEGDDADDELQAVLGVVASHAVSRAP